MKSVSNIIQFVCAMLVIQASLLAQAQSPTTSLSPQNAVILSREAETDYQAQAYKKALQKYQRLLDNAYTTKEVHYNMGNIHSKLNHLGHAIAHYKQALYHAPRDQDIRYNLAAVETRRQDKAAGSQDNFSRALLSWHHHSSPNESFWLFFLCLIILLSLCSWYWILKKTINHLPIALCLALTIITGTSWLNKASGQAQHNQGVAIKNNTPIRSAAGKNYPLLFNIQDGTTFKIIKAKDSWLQIEIDAKRKGWAQKSTAVTFKQY